MIGKFAEDIEKSISSSSIVLASNVQKYFGPDNKTLYIKGQISFIDSSVLEISLYAVEAGNALSVGKYRLHTWGAADSCCSVMITLLIILKLLHILTINTCLIK